MRWEVPLVDVLRFRHAELYLDGHTLRRAGAVGRRHATQRRARFDSFVARYATRN